MGMHKGVNEDPLFHHLPQKGYVMLPAHNGPELAGITLSNSRGLNDQDPVIRLSMNCLDVDLAHPRRHSRGHILAQILDLEHQTRSTGQVALILCPPQPLTFYRRPPMLGKEADREVFGFAALVLRTSPH